MSLPTSGHALQEVVRSRFAQAERLEREISELRETWSLRRHPFLQRWLNGNLGSGPLQAFATEHYHAIVSLIGVADRAYRQAEGLLAEQLERYAGDQQRSLELWLQFAAATGWTGAGWYFGEDPLPETVACARSWCGEGHSLAEDLVTIWAVESALAPLAAVQLDALNHRYGFDASATRYFAQRARHGPEAAAVGRAALTSLLPVTSPLELVCHAELTYRSYLELLDGVEAFSDLAD
ncbi:MAG: hypothetical protein ACJ780_12235 [Solirubrobacteraceae bacterium]